jgi:hypothetical protein
MFAALRKLKNETGEIETKNMGLYTHTHTHTHTYIYIYRIVTNLLECNVTNVLIVIECGKKQDRQCTYNVILRRVRLTIFAVEKQLLRILSVCL